MNNLMHELTADVWAAVEAGRRPALTTAMIYQAALGRMLTSPGYDPEADARMDYLRAVLACLRERRRMDVDQALHATVGMLCGLVETRRMSGRELAAGV